MAKRKKWVPVNPDVEASAELLAMQVWDSGGKPARDLIPEGLAPRHFIPILECALDRKWLVERDGVIVPGKENPRPVKKIGNPEGSSWGFGRGFPVPVRSVRSFTRGGLES